MSESTPYGIAVFKNVMVATRDGTRLATNIHRPTRDGALVEGRFPTILCRTSYDASAPRYVDIADYFVPHGYVVILQDIRGRGQSEGLGQYYHVVNVHEGRDGYDTVEWIAAQPWSNGRVGTVGSSHPGLTQVHMALYRPPHLTAMWPDVTPINMYDHQSRRGGAMQLQMFGALFVHALDAQELRGDPAGREAIIQAMGRMRELVYATPFRRDHTPLALVANLEETLLNYYTRGDYDEYWALEPNDLERQLNRHADVPVTLTGGWYDLFANAPPEYWRRLTVQNTAPARLIMGPWNHTAMRGGQTFAGDVDFGPDSAWGNAVYFTQQRRFFERWLRDVDTGVDADPPLRLFIMGGGPGGKTREGRLAHGGRWRDEHEWPLARTRWTPFYLHADGFLSPEPPTTEGLRSFSYDPAHPVPTIGAASSGLMEIAPLGDDMDPFWGKAISPWARLRSIVVEGGAHQKESPGMVAAQSPYRPLAERADVLVFQTPPLAEDTEVTGPLEVVLWVSSSAPDTDFTAKLVDVYPPSDDYPEGYHLNLTDSILRVRYRDGWDTPSLLTPGEVVRIVIRPAPTANLFARGHRIRLDISSSNFPRFDLNPNTGEPMGRHTRMEKAVNTVYMDSARASHVVLPVVRDL